MESQEFYHTLVQCEPDFCGHKELLDFMVEQEGGQCWRWTRLRLRSSASFLTSRDKDKDKIDFMDIDQIIWPFLSFDLSYTFSVSKYLIDCDSERYFYIVLYFFL